jgi:hypothetical protein
VVSVKSRSASAGECGLPDNVRGESNYTPAWNRLSCCISMQVVDQFMIESLICSMHLVPLGSTHECERLKPLLVD